MRVIFATGLSSIHEVRHSEKNGRLTPGITRPPAPLLEFENCRVGGRVHAVVRRRVQREIAPFTALAM